MDEADRQVMSEAFGDIPWAIDASGVSLARRPRFYWVTWKMQKGEGISTSSSRPTFLWLGRAEGHCGFGKVSHPWVV